MQRRSHSKWSIQILEDDREHASTHKAAGGRKLDTFVIAHDQELLLAAEADGRYRHLPNPRFVFVGNGPADRLAGRDDVVVARELPKNLEHRPNLLAFTAWFAVSRNRLSSARYVSMLEYDIDVTASFAEATASALDASPGALVGYVPMPLSDPIFGGTDAPLVSSLLKAYGLELNTLVANQLEATGYDLWTATSNLSLSNRSLDSFVDWYVPVADAFGADPMGGHVHERCIAVFGLLTGRESAYVPGVLAHRQERSHGIDVALEMQHQRGVRRMAASPTDPDLSVVVIANNGGQDFLRTLQSLSADYQADMAADDFEVIVVDDGSRPPLDRDQILAAGPNLRHFYRGSAVRDSAQALDFGVEMARGKRLGLVSKANGTASRGLLHLASKAVDRFESSLVRVHSEIGRPSTASFEPAAIFCSRRRFIELGGFEGVSDLCRREHATGTTCITLLGEAILPEIELQSRSERTVGETGRAANDEILCFGSRPPSRSRELERATSEIARRDALIAEILSSRSWRLTEPLRRLMAFLKTIARSTRHSEPSDLSRPTL